MLGTSAFSVRTEFSVGTRGNNRDLTTHKPDRPLVGETSRYRSMTSGQNVKLSGYDSLECHRYNVCDFEIRTSISESG
jgi:hypothetical protein